MLDFFEKIPFDDIDGGVWKQDWDISLFYLMPSLEVLINKYFHLDA